MGDKHFRPKIEQSGRVHPDILIQKRGGYQLFQG